jgi:hypothetical protein
MDKSEEIKKEIDDLINDQAKLIELAEDVQNTVSFGTHYQKWYSKAYKVVESLAPERLAEFNSYYLSDPKRKTWDATNYVIQDYVNGFGARTDAYQKPRWDIHNAVKLRIVNQTQIVLALKSRIDSVLQDVKGHLFAELQDSELAAAKQLKKISVRAAGALAGVVLERHLQRVAANHSLKISKKNPTISDLNDPLRQADVYDVPTWRKIQLLADIRNMCSHQKEAEPSAEHVDELIEGVNSLIKRVF